MTPGQTITLVQVSVAVLIAGLAAYRDRWAAARACIALIWALALTRVFKAALPPDVAFIAWSALWVSVGGWIIRLGMMAEDRASALAGGAAVLSGLFDGAAWLVGSATALWSPVVMGADLCVAAALAALLWSAAGGKPARIPEAKLRPAAVPAAVRARGRQVIVRSGQVDSQGTRKGRGQ
jgi:hypothetical protein